MTRKVHAWDGTRFVSVPPFVVSDGTQDTPLADPRFAKCVAVGELLVRYVRIRVSPSRWFSFDSADLVLIQVGDQTDAFPFQHRLSTEAQVQIHVKEALRARD